MLELNKLYNMDCMEGMKMDDRGCDTCLHLDGMNGICRLGLADEWTVRSCDTSMCPQYRMDPFYRALEGDKEGRRE